MGGLWSAKGRSKAREAREGAGGAGGAGGVEGAGGTWLESKGSRSTALLVSAEALCTEARCVASAAEMLALWLAFSAVIRTVSSTDADATSSDTAIGATDAAAAKAERKSSCLMLP